MFSVPVPASWTVEDRDEHLALASPDGGVRLDLLTFSENDLGAVIERAWAVADPGIEVPVDAGLEPRSDPGIERQAVVNDDGPTGEVPQAIAQLHEGVPHVMLVDADLEAVQRRGTQISLIFGGYRILALEER